MASARWKSHDPNFSRFWLIHPCDRRTDRQTDGIAIAYARLAYTLSRAKTSMSCALGSNVLLKEELINIRRHPVWFQVTALDRDPGAPTGKRDLGAGTPVRSDAARRQITLAPLLNSGSPNQTALSEFYAEAWKLPFLFTIEWRARVRGQPLHMLVTTLQVLYCLRTEGRQSKRRSTSFSVIFCSGCAVNDTVITQSER